MGETPDLDFYRQLLLDLQQANSDMEASVYRVLRQEGASELLEDITDQAIMTNKVTIALLQGIIAMHG